MILPIPNADRIAENAMKSSAKLLHQGMWGLFVIAAALMFILRRSAPRTGSIWVLGIGVLAFMVTFAVRDLMRKVGQRHTEDRIVKDVRSFLEREPVHEEKRYVLGTTQPARSEEAADKDGVPAGSADFMSLKNATAYHTSAGEPVVFDAIPSREVVTFRADFYAVLQPVAHHC